MTNKQYQGKECVSKIRPTLRNAIVLTEEASVYTAELTLWTVLKQIVELSFCQIWFPETNKNFTLWFEDNINARPCLCMFPDLYSEDPCSSSTAESIHVAKCCSQYDAETHTCRRNTKLMDSLCCLMKRMVEKVVTFVFNERYDGEMVREKQIIDKSLYSNATLNRISLWSQTVHFYQDFSYPSIPLSLV